MNVRFYIDPETDAPHIHRHDVHEGEAEDVLRRPLEDRPGRDGARVAMAKREPGDIFELSMFLIRRRTAFFALRRSI
jgi:hypothetical protein